MGRQYRCLVDEGIPNSFHFQIFRYAMLVNGLCRCGLAWTVPRILNIFKLFLPVPFLFSECGGTHSSVSVF